MKKKILVIDDDVMSLRMLKKYLEVDYEVQLENAGYRFIENSYDYHADMILLDVEMPVMNGMEVYDAYLQLEHHDIPVVFISGVSNPKIVREAIEKGAAGHILKTASKMEIITKIREIFREVSGQRNLSNTIVLGSNPQHIKLVKIAMESANYHVRVALSIAEVIQELKRSETDVLIIVEPLPYAGESEAYEMICSYYKEIKLPVVYCENVYTRESILDKVGKVIGGQ